MSQVHRRFTDDQVRALLQAYCRGGIRSALLQEALGIQKTQFFALLKDYRRDPERFSIRYARASRQRLLAEVEARIESELLCEKRLVDDPQLPISSYNYTVLRNRLLDDGIEVSLTTIIARARALGCHRARPPHKAHDREVQTEAIGALVQHDASIHLWSPFATEKWTLITSIDDYSRKLLFADFVSRETTWAHIQAAAALIQECGLPLCYYVDSLRIFRFVQGRDSVWRNHVLQTDDADPQWRQLMRVLNINVTHALSPQAKGKVERPYRWLQDHIVRTCARENLSQLNQVREVLRDEVNRYNNRQVHSTTKEIPRLRYERAMTQGLSLFRPFKIPAPFTSLDDIFCLRMIRVVSTYRRIKVANQDIPLPSVPAHESVELHLVPNETTNSMSIRIWWNVKLVHTTVLPLNIFRVHF